MYICNIHVFTYLMPRAIHAPCLHSAAIPMYGSIHSVYIYIYTYMYEMCFGTYVCMYLCMHVCMCEYMCMFSCMYVQMYLCIYVCVCLPAACVLNVVAVCCSVLPCVAVRCNVW